MEFYAVAINEVSADDLETFNRISAVLKVMPNLVFDATERHWGACKNQVSCHLLCRALADHFKVTVHDGYFTKGYEHSWLKTSNETSIIDVYPVAGAAPFIVAANFPSPWEQLYRESDDLRSKFKTPQFLERLAQTRRSMADVLRKLESEPPS